MNLFAETNLFIVLVGPIAQSNCHSFYIKCFMCSQTAQSTGFKSELFGGHRSSFINVDHVGLSAMSDI